VSSGAVQAQLRAALCVRRTEGVYQALGFGGGCEVRAPGAAAADHDDTVVPSHSYKFVAALQHVLAGYPNSPQRNPLILRIAHNAGHGAGAQFAA